MDVTISSEQVFRLHELSHEMSNTFGLVMDELIMAIGKGERGAVLTDRLAATLELSIRGTTALQKLMWEIAVVSQQSPVPRTGHPFVIPKNVPKEHVKEEQGSPDRAGPSTAATGSRPWLCR